jgi:hypothetical protein
MKQGIYTAAHLSGVGLLWHYGKEDLRGSQLAAV